jgi:diacylglycerol kinase family enzyme
MRAAAILGLGCSLRDLDSFRHNSADIFEVGLPSSPDGLDAVLIFGGDGTVHRHLGALVRLGLPVLVVPAGSGNDFARALGLRRVRESRAGWQKFATGGANVREIDLGIITPLPESSPPTRHYYACVGGVGLDADIARRANQLPRWLRRRGGYALALPASLIRFASFPLKISVEQPDIATKGEFELRRQGPAMLAAFANTPFYGDGMKIAPEAQLDDGQFDVCLIEGIHPFKLLCMFPSVYFGRHLEIREVEYFRTRCARLETESPMDVYADGEFVCRTPAEFSVAHNALRVIVSDSLEQTR